MRFLLHEILPWLVVVVSLWYVAYALTYGGYSPLPALHTFMSWVQAKEPKPLHPLDSRE